MKIKRQKVEKIFNVQLFQFSDGEQAKHIFLFTYSVFSFKLPCSFLNIKLGQVNHKP